LLLLVLAEAREDVESVVGRLGLVVLGVLGGEFVSSLGVGFGFGLVGVLGVVVALVVLVLVLVSLRNEA
jgi:hypothetical protein